MRDGGTVTLDVVKDLVTEGMNPAWCVSESYLAETFGIKGSPKPSKQDRETPAPSRTDRPSQPKAGRSVSRSNSESDSPPDDIEFFKDRIRILEQEKQREAERHDKLVANLFEQLAVKDRQISAWDDLTQNITKGLATGQLQPRLTQPDRPTRKTGPSNGEDSQKEPPSGVIEVNSTRTKRKPQKKARTKKRTSTSKPKAVKPKGKQARKTKKPATSHNWYEMPTLTSLLRRRK